MTFNFKLLPKLFLADALTLAAGALRAGDAARRDFAAGEAKVGTTDCGK